MSLLKQMVKEMAAAGSTSAHSVAAVPGSLFNGGVVDGSRAKKRARGGKNRKMIRRIIQLTDGYVIMENLGANSGETDFSSSDVISKMDAQEKKSKAGDDTTAFGMEDDQGNLVKVYVKTDSAEDFEKALASMLAGEDDNDDDENSALEIAEVLFKLKDKFEIVDVVWPEIEGDEEEEQEMEDDTGDEMGPNDLEGGDSNQEGGDDLEGDNLEGGDLEGGDLEGGDLEGGADEEDAKSALDKVIDMMKADAEAKKAEAEAKKAEAKAKEADAVARASQAKVTQEEQILDMEAYYKDKADQEKEAKQLAKMAKYKHDKAREAEGMLATESTKTDNDPYRYNDGEDDDDREITTDELATLILKNLRHN